MLELYDTSQLSPSQMKYVDFSSLVQLGVGLHLGTAALQHYGEIGVAPLERAVSRIRSLHSDRGKRPPDDLEEELDKLETDVAIFKSQLFGEFKKYWIANTVAAFLLVICLFFISWKADDTLPDWVAVVFSALSVLPAPVTLIALWLDASKAIRPIKNKADDLETRTFASL